MNSPPTGFRFATSILNRLGEELVPNLDQAIIELVRNAYDADATLCTISLEGVTSAGGSIVLSDNGVGMRRADIENGWLVLGGSAKEHNRLTPIKGRRTVGDKGLGRLSALRAGSNAYMTTRHYQEASAHEVSIDWSDFDSARIVEDVSIPVRPTSRDSPGTTIRLTGLKRALSRAEVDRLGRNIVLLTNPFEEGSDFRVNLDAPEFPELEARVRNAYLGDAEYVLKAEIREDGTAFAEVRDWKDTVLYSAESSEWLSRQAPEDSVYSAPATRFELYSYILNRNAFAGRASTIGEVRQWLKTVGGVHFYHRGFRVPPYGDAGHDWLDMNLSRARSPEERPSTNNSVGRVIVDDPEAVLTQKTDRVGFIESSSFLEIRRFAKNALEWFSRRRLKEAEARREHIKKETNKSQLEARRDLEKSISNSLPPEEKEQALKALDRMQQSFEKSIKATRDDLVLYRSLATAGTTAAVFAHEIGKPIRTIVGAKKRVQRNIQGLKPASLVAKLNGPLNLIHSASDRLSRFAGMQIDFLKREKRRHGAVDVNKVLRQLHELWQPVLNDSRITLEFVPHDVDGAVIFGAEALLETIITNCLTNSVSAFEQPGARTKGRKIYLRAVAEGDTIAIEIEDNGPGISMSIDEIWLPGRTTRVDGTGFGLTIAKDSALDLGGTYAAAAGAEGGARFRFVFRLVSMTEDSGGTA
jgi:signal transduction histidine kinase